MYVAPFTGAWIEIVFRRIELSAVRVAPFTGAWIEIRNMRTLADIIAVAPFTGAWIEIARSFQCMNMDKCRSLHGSVD